MIPKFDHNGVLPPYTGADPTVSANRSPYPCSMTELISCFSYTNERRPLLEGLLNYREALSDLGITNGHQWIDGSFLEDCETIRGRPPSDIDIVTFANRPHNVSDKDWNQIVLDNPELFDPEESKDTYQIDAYYVDLNVVTYHFLVSRVVYWHGLYSHQRDTETWKGILDISLASDDDVARQTLASMPRVPTS